MEDFRRDILRANQNVVKNIEASFEKGKTQYIPGVGDYPEGTIKEWSGKKFIKQGKKWLPHSEGGEKKPFPIEVYKKIAAQIPSAIAGYLELDWEDVEGPKGGFRKKYGGIWDSESHEYLKPDVGEVTDKVLHVSDIYSLIEKLAEYLEPQKEREASFKEGKTQDPRTTLEWKHKGDVVEYLKSQHPEFYNFCKQKIYQKFKAYFDSVNPPSKEPKQPKPFGEVKHRPSKGEEGFLRKLKSQTSGYKDWINTINEGKNNPATREFAQHIYDTIVKKSEGFRYNGVAYSGIKELVQPYLDSHNTKENQELAEKIFK